jgi:hypothetical protein
VLIKTRGLILRVCIEFRLTGIFIILHEQKPLVLTSMQKTSCFHDGGDFLYLRLSHIYHILPAQSSSSPKPDESTDVSQKREESLECPWTASQ